MTKRKIGLLVMAYGTPYKEEDIERYYTHIRRGRKPSPEALEDLRSRYEAIGGISPLAKITEQQASQLADFLNNFQPDIEFKVYIGLKHIEPFIEDAVHQMKQDGIEEAVSLVLAPHFSTFSVKSYNSRAAEESEKIGGPRITSIKSWYNEPKFIAYWANEINETIQMMTEEEKNHFVMIVSAHSLPEKIIAAGDPYPDQLKETADLLAEATAVKHYEVGWQSAGNTPDPWIGPDVQDLTRDLFEKNGYKAFLYVPAGFVADHLEVLYDNDYECKVVTNEVGAGYYRPAMPNAQPAFIEALGTIVWNHLKSRNML